MGQKAKEIFSQFRNPHDNYLHRREFPLALRAVLDAVGESWDLTNQDVDDYYQEFDTSGDGRLSMKEFRRAVIEFFGEKYEEYD